MFGRFFTVTLNGKVKRINLIVFWQIISTILLTFFTFFDLVHLRVNDRSVSPFLGGLEIFFSTAIVLCFLLYIMTCIDTERINSNESYRLIPLSDIKYYLGNLLSSVTSFLYFIVIEIICFVIFAGATYTLDQKFQSDVNTFFNRFDSPGFFGAPKDVRAVAWIAVNLIIFLILLAFLIYFFISFLNLSSRAIIDFLPGFPSKTFLTISRLFIIVLLCWIFSKIANFVGEFYQTPLDLFLTGLQGESLNLLALSNLGMLVFTLLFLAINLVLFTNFFEPNEKR